MDLNEAAEAYYMNKKIRLKDVFDESEYIAKNHHRTNLRLTTYDIFEGKWEVAIDYVDFNTALKATCDGKAITRSVFTKGTKIFLSKRGELPIDSVLVVDHGDGVINIWAITEDNLLAKDWIIL